MKKIVLFVVFSLLSVTAGAWGLDRWFVRLPLLEEYGANRRVNYTSSALYILLRGGKADFTACTDNYAFGNSFNHADQTDNLGLLNQMLPQWIAQVRSQIETSGRAAEFADVLTWLPAQITITSAPCEKADIRVKSISKRPAGRNVWAYDSSLGTWQLLFPYGENALAEAWQETGLFWGLGVLTEIARPQTAHQGKLANTADEKYSLYSVAQSHPAPGASVMWWKQPAAVSLTCDDVEGFINAVDFVQFMEGETSPRLENGWKSLCGHPYYYLRGRVAVDAEGLEGLRQETLQYRQNGQALTTLKQLLRQWDTYYRDQVLPELTQYRKQLEAQTRPLDDEGLMLSAQVHHLEQVGDCAFHAIRRIKEYGSNVENCGGADCPALRDELGKLSCSVQQDPLKTPGLMEATPLERDYPTGKVHTCAVCGKPIEIGKEYRDAAYVHHKKHATQYIYYRHATCSLNSVEQAQAYKDEVTVVQAPTYAQLLVRSQLAKDLAARKPTGTQTQDISLPFLDSGDIPAILRRSATASVPQAPVVASSPAAQAAKPASAEKPATSAKHTHSRALGTVLPGEKVHCSVCGEEIHEGETYYKRTESQFIHRHGQCAYSFFAKKHDVDEDALASYDRVYSFETPNEVATARADMKALGLSVDTVRQLRTQKEGAVRQQAAQKLQEQKRQEAREQLNTQCRVHLKVTAQDVARFKTLYAKQLARIEQKVAKRQKLTQQQKRLQKQYKQLLQDEKTTQKCVELEQAAR